MTENQFYKEIRSTLNEFASENGFEFYSNDKIVMNKYTPEYHIVINAVYFKEKNVIRFCGWEGHYSPYFYTDTIEFFINKIELKEKLFFALCNFGMYIQCVKNEFDLDSHFQKKSEMDVISEDQIPKIINDLNEMYSYAPEMIENLNSWSKILNFIEINPERTLFQDTIFTGFSKLFLYFILNKKDEFKDFLFHPCFTYDRAVYYMEKLQNEFSEKNRLELLKFSEDHRVDKNYIKRIEAVKAYNSTAEKQDDIVKLIDLISYNLNLKFDTQSYVLNELLEEQSSYYIGKGDGVIAIVPPYDGDAVVAEFSRSMQESINSIIQSISDEYIFLSEYEASIVMCMYYSSTSKVSGVLYMNGDKLKTKGIIDPLILNQMNENKDDYEKAFEFFSQKIKKITGKPNLQSDALQGIKMNKLIKI
jgi:hypothetical protein